jgi:hypothetical protein
MLGNQGTGMGQTQKFVYLIYLMCFQTIEMMKKYLNETIFSR